MSSHYLSLAPESTAMSGKSAIQESESDWCKIGEPVWGINAHRKNPWKGREIKALLFQNKVLETHQEDSNITPHLMRDGDIHQEFWQGSPSPKASAAVLVQNVQE